MAEQWERVRTNKGWHVRFRADNGEVVVHGEGLTGTRACDTAILSVARAHSPVHRATIRLIPDSNGQHAVRVWSQYEGEGYKSTLTPEIPIVDLDERTPGGVLAKVSRRLVGTPKGVQQRAAVSPRYSIAEGGFIR